MRIRCGLAVVLSVALVLGGCETTHHRAIIDHTAPALRTFTFRVLSFHYPAAWYSAGETCPDVLPPGLPYVIVYLSNEPLNTLVSRPKCPGPLPARLKAGGVLVTWFVQYPMGTDPHVTLTPPVTSRRVDGYTVTEHVGDATICHGFRTDTTVAAMVDAGSWLAWFNACLRGPDLKTSEAQVQAMLASVKVGGLQPSTRASSTTSTSQPTEASAPRPSEVVVRGMVGGPPPCAPLHSDGAYGADTANPQRAPLQAAVSFGPHTRWAICGASPASSSELLNLRSVNAGATWTVTDTGLQFSPHHAGDELAVALSTPVNGSILIRSLVGQSEAAYTTTDGGLSWHK